MNKLFVVGLTGPTGAGKSNVAAALAERGCFIIDADALSRLAVKPGSPCLAALVDHFSPCILLPDGSLDRSRLALAAFASAEETAALNAIVHPEVLRMIHELLETATQQGKEIAVIDAPLLFEAGLGAICHCTVAVLAPREQRLQRICRRDNLTAEQAQNRMNVQPQDAYYEQRATVVVHNAGDENTLHQTVGALFTQLEEWRHDR